MTNPLESVPLWRSALSPQGDGLNPSRDVLRQAFLGFRERVADLVATLGAELPGLTVHDITHLDALWRVAHEIAGPEYPLNPAEAFVLGGAILLHDAAHVLAAYPGRLLDIKGSTHWGDLIAQRYQGKEPDKGSEGERSAIFQVLRHLHAEQARQLPSIHWKINAQGERLYLIEHHALREYYGDLIGEIASSHHWSPEKVATSFSRRKVSCPSWLAPANWEVDALKVALLLRTADAAHMDASRAPWFLFALRQPQGLSAEHWRFQAKMGQATCTPQGDLRLSSGARFSPAERTAWWLALDTARMVDRELRSAAAILQEEGRHCFAASRVLGVESASAFAHQVPVSGWEPVDISPRVGDASRLISKLGGAALYGESYTAPLRELLQNGLDAIAALQALNGPHAQTGALHVQVREAGPDSYWLEVTDNGIGMSRYVLTTVLLDFGASLWASDTLREELPGLAQSKFKPVGKFGIGFFSIFMLGDEVLLTTRRFEPSEEGALHWRLHFEDGLTSRPALVTPGRVDVLPQSGTRVAVKVSEAKLDLLLDASSKSPNPFESLFPAAPTSEQTPKRCNLQLAHVVAALCPTSEVRITTAFANEQTYLAVGAADWKTIEPELLLARVSAKGNQLYPLYDMDGDLIGRLNVDSSPSSIFQEAASLVYQGVVCGKVDALIGVVHARENNQDARRVVATPAGTRDNWRDWAERVVSGQVALRLEQKIYLHPLIPDQDLEVWTTNGGDVTLTGVLARIKDLSEVWLHDGKISHEDSDDMGSDRFRQSFEMRQSVVCHPSFEPRQPWWPLADERTRDRFPWFLGVKAVDYVGKFEAALALAWGGFEKDDSEHVCIGNVGGEEVERWTIRYRRPE